MNSEKLTVNYIPSREASYEQLLETDWDFPAPCESMDDAMVRMNLLDTLEIAIKSLNIEEQKLIREIYYQGKSEREVSAAYHLTQAAIHKRKKKILKKLKKFFCDFGFQWPFSLPNLIRRLLYSSTNFEK